MHHRVGFAALVATVICAATAIAAEPARSGSRFLSLNLAMEAAAAAAHACAARGWAVSVSIVDVSGNVKLQAKGDGSTIHTKDSSYRKAYTTVTMAPIFGFDKLGEWVEKLQRNPNASTYATLPDIYLLPGAVAIKIHGEIVAALGVGGAPGGENDEICAVAGLASIRDKLGQ